MIHVYATAKLRKKLPLDKNHLLPDSEREIKTDASEIAHNPLDGWHAHLVNLQRRQCLLMVHDISRFALFMPCLTKADFARLNWHFQDVLMNTLLKAGVPAEIINRVPEYFAPLCFDHQYNRSVQGTLNNTAQDLEHMLWVENASITDVLPYSTSAWLSERPCMMKGQRDCIWPIKLMQDLLTKPEVYH